MTYTIKNIAWVETIFAPMQDTNSVTVQIFVKAWSIYENKKNNGISHFLEHMFFKWWEKYPTPKSVAEAVDSFGGTFNAYTSDEYASYYVKCAPDFIEQAIDVLGDMMLNAKFNSEELEREKGVIVQEIMMKQDNPARLVYDKWKLFYNGDNSYGRSTLGPVENVKNFRQEDLLDYKNALYSKDNLIIVVAGKIQDEQFVSTLLEEAFSQLPSDKKLDKPPFEDYSPLQKQDKFVKHTEQNHLILSAKWFPGNTQERFKANVLSVILWWNMSSRLFQNIREQQWLCYYISASHYSSSHTGEFFIRAGLEKQRFDFGLDKIFEELDIFAKEWPKQEEFDNAIGYLQWQLQMWIESSDEMAEFLGSQYLLYHNIIWLTEILNIYKNMKISDIVPYLSMLKKENMFVYWLE